MVARRSLLFFSRLTSSAVATSSAPLQFVICKRQQCERHAEAQRPLWRPRRGLRWWYNCLVFIGGSYPLRIKNKQPWRVECHTDAENFIFNIYFIFNMLPPSWSLSFLIFSTRLTSSAVATTSTPLQDPWMTPVVSKNHSLHLIVCWFASNSHIIPRRSRYWWEGNFFLHQNHRVNLFAPVIERNFTDVEAGSRFSLNHRPRRRKRRPRFHS